MFKLDIDFFGLRVVIMDKQAQAYSEKFSGNPDHFFITPLQRFGFSFQKFLERPISFMRAEFDRYGAPTIYYRRGGGQFMRLRSALHLKAK